MMIDSSSVNASLYAIRTILLTMCAYEAGMISKEQFREFLGQFICIDGKIEELKMTNNDGVEIVKREIDERLQSEEVDEDA